MTASHRFEESDELRLIVRAASFPDVLREAGRALAGLAVGSGNTAPGPDGGIEIEVRAGDAAGLLVEWLNELIYRAESEGWLAREFEVLDTGSGHARVRARGIPWPDKSFPVKAATLDRARVSHGAAGVTAEITLDV